MMPSIIPSPKPPNILDRHISTRINLDRRICHKINGVMGPFLVVHGPERTPECKFCQALGIPRVKNPTF